MFKWLRSVFTTGPSEDEGMLADSESRDSQGRKPWTVADPFPTTPVGRLTKKDKVLDHLDALRPTFSHRGGTAFIPRGLCTHMAEKYDANISYVYQVARDAGYVVAPAASNGKQ